MKKNAYSNGWPRWLLKKLLFMKICIVLVMATALQAAANTGYGQETVSLNVDNARLSKVLKAIQKKTDYRFVFNNAVVDDIGTIKIAVTEIPVLELLPRILKGTNLEFVQMRNNLVVIRENTIIKSKGISTINENSGLVVRQADIKVNGLVTDSAGNILSGVSVSLKSKESVGTTTDLNGRYVLEVPANGTLVFSMSGYITQEVAISGKESINVTMKKDVQLMEETVVVAFGNKVKKSDMIGSVTSISPSELKIPSSNLTAALQGRIAGVISYQRSGEPGLDNADFFVRGVGTFGVNKQPLILLDNMEVDIDDLARIPWDDLETFSVLKDASAAAVYGARAANGVIIVTTKRGKDGPAKINLRVEQRVSAPTQNLKIADPVTFMKMHREAVLTRDPLSKDATYSLEKIDRTAGGDDPIQYPAVNWLDFITRKVTSTQNYNLGVSGGGQTARYNVSANYTTDNGLLKIEPINYFNSNVRFNVFSFLSNVDINLTKSTLLVARVKANLQDYNGPPSSGSAAYGNAIRSNPVLFQPVYTAGENQSYIKHPLFGNFGNGQYLNAYAEIVKGYSERRRSNLAFQTELHQDLSSVFTEGLKFRGLLNITRRSYFTQSRVYSPFYYTPVIDFDTKVVGSYLQLNPESGREYLNFVSGEREQVAVLYGEAQWSYNRTFALKHGISGSLIGTLRNNVSTPTDEGSLIATLPYRNISFSGNASYVFDERYYAQFSFGYNGSERFAAGNRFGFFPSFGVAWSVHKEKFMEGLWPTISNLRFRATHGWVGNDNINNTRFFYLSDVNLNNGGKGYTFGLPAARYSVPGVSISRYENPYVQWEISRQTNFGIDLGMFKGALTFVGEYYRQFRYNIVQSRAAIPASTGLQADVLANLGKYKSSGFEGELSYSKSITKDLFFQGRGTFTYATGGYVYYEEPNFQYSYLSRIGLHARQQTGYIAERLFIDDEEVFNSPEQQFGGIPVLGGDIKYVDVNKDGVVNSNDQVPIGLPTTPEVNYGFGLTTGYKSFDLSFFFSGLARTSLFISPYYRSGDNYGVAPFGSVTAPNAVLQSWADSYWSEENQDIYAQWPRLSQDPTANNTQTSTFWMRNGSLLRLKQVELGFNLKQSILKRYKMNTLRIYFSGTNLFKWSPFKLWDPEMGGNGLAYPLQRVFNFGINISI